MVDIFAESNGRFPEIAKFPIDKNKVEFKKGK